ncbi:1000_t:CDS:2 [Racocetra persica]|uniref:1000_t:CDS:1 n=1 Tax=Racocetra persica TaxID=160502 RepID=A0ACA9LDV5_9GLOM|nr:1000_t:CDS:2 [Racocetra persica]
MKSDHMLSDNTNRHARLAKKIREQFHDEIQNQVGSGTFNYDTLKRFSIDQMAKSEVNDADREKQVPNDDQW